MDGWLEHVCAAGEGLQARRGQQVGVSENFMILCYSNSKSWLNLVVQTWWGRSIYILFFDSWFLHLPLRELFENWWGVGKATWDSKRDSEINHLVFYLSESHDLDTRVSSSPSQLWLTSVFHFSWKDSDLFFLVRLIASGWGRDSDSWLSIKFFFLQEI